MAVKQDDPKPAAEWRWLNYNSVHNDLREFLDRADRIGEVKKISGASWDLEMAGISEMFGHEHPDNPPALLFDDIPGYPKGYRVVWGAGNSRLRFALTYGFPEPTHTRDLIQGYRDRMRAGFKLVPPVTVKNGPVMENVDRDDAVDLFKFPTPRVHEVDGG